MKEFKIDERLLGYVTILNEFTQYMVLLTPKEAEELADEINRVARQARERKVWQDNDVYSTNLAD